MTILSRALGASLLLASLANCGGGETATSQGGSPIAPPYDGSTDVMTYLIGPAATSAEILRLDRTSGTITTGTGTPGANNRFNGDLFAGTVDLPVGSSTGTLALDAGGTGAVVANWGRSFFVGDGTFLSIVGAAATNVPTSGTAALSGQSQIAVTNGGPAIFLGTATAQVDFDAGRVDLRFDDSRNAENWLTIDNARISGTTVTGGTASASATLAPTGLSGTITAHQSRFFSTDTTTLGGVFHIEETAGGETVKAQGVYFAN